MPSEIATAAGIWLEAAARLKQQLSPETYKQWFANVCPLCIEESNVLVIGVGDDFFGEWFMDSFGCDIERALQNIHGVDYSFTLKAGALPADFHPDDDSSQNAEKETMGEVAAPEAMEKTEASGEPDNGLQAHTFDNFVVGEENRYAFAAAKTAAEQPGLYNPLYIYGSTGIGKSHLLQAAAAEYQALHPEGKVRYVPCEELLNEYVDALRTHTDYQFRASLRELDMLLVDDVHVLGNKSALQEEFFNTFNALYRQGHQIILTSDKQPCEIKGLESRLVSRFESGVTTEMLPPEYETRLAILKQDQQGHLIQFDDTILQFVASNLSSSVRVIKGALKALVAYASAMTNCPMTTSVAERLLHKRIEEEHAAGKLSIEQIQRRVADYFDVRLTDLLSSKRPKNIAEPRMVAMYLCRRLTNYSFPEIGAAFGKNHATVINAMKKVPQLCQGSEDFRRSVAQIERQLRGS